MHDPTPTKRSLLSIVGPALIVASVVLGPGSIVTASKVGVGFGYSMIWVLALAAVLMVGAVALSARLGVGLEHTPGEELARRLGRPAAAALGVLVFVIIACFQSSNNLAILAAIEPMAGDAPAWVSIVTLLTLNALICGFLFGFRKLYKPLERAMGVLVAFMLIAFAANLGSARPSPTAILAGLIPRWPEGDGAAWLSILGLFATTFSIAGAFYQAYLVREKGWRVSDARRGLIDSVAGIAVLGGITGMIMVTSAAVLHGKIDPSELKSVADVASQLKPLFGGAANALFAGGLFAGAFSSFLVNAMIGGTVLSDGLGLGAAMDRPGPKCLTAAALGCGAIVACWSKAMGQSPVALIVLAQALTVLGGPILAGVLLYLATRPDITGARRAPVWMIVLGWIGLIATAVLAGRTAWTLWLKATS